MLELTSVFLCDLTYTQQTIAADVMPNSIGGIATFTEAARPQQPPIKLFKYPEKLIAALERTTPDVIGFSNYIWNSTLSYNFARVIKQRSPSTVVVFGGPNYPVVEEEQEQWLRTWPAVDFVILKEGELAFSRLLQSLQEEGGDIEAVKRRRIPSVHAILDDGTAVLTKEIERIRDLTQIPSPYLSGRLDEFFDGKLLPIIQTNRGCPFSCTFCVEGVRYYNKVYCNSTEKVAREIDYIGRRMQQVRARGGRNDLFIADSNFGMYAEDLDTCRALAKSRREYQWPEYINVATGKNKKERVLEASRIIDGALRLSGSVQSLEKQVLENIKRDNISADGLMDLGLRAGQIGANTYSEVILGLPGGTKAGHFETVKTVMEAGFTNIYLFQLMLLPGTEIATTASKRQYGMTTRYRVLPRCYGHFTLDGDDVRAAEIEEICVANNTLSFQDYLDCRKMHLIVTIFYNDGVFGTLLKLMKLYGISPFRWISLIEQQQPPAGLARLYQSFLKHTETELWESRAELEAFIRAPGNVEKFIAGELGNNLLFVHKTRAIFEHIGDLAAVARTALIQCLEEAGKLDSAVEAFVDDALAYHRCRAANLFKHRDDVPAAGLRFDIPSFDADGSPSSIVDYELGQLTTFNFLLNDDQSQIIERFLSIYGDSPVGIGRILSKVFLRKLYRHAIAEDRSGPVVRTVTGDGLLYGLQQ
jgi:radical SAM superfamily enzyme YgiQ (UPF0313 family)